MATALDGTRFWSVRGGDPELSSVVATAATTCRSAEFVVPEAPTNEE